MKLKQTMLLLFLILLLFAQCETTEPPSNGSLSLTLEDISCTEGWLLLRSTNLQIPNSITLTQNGQARLVVSLTTTDTLLYVDSLLPNQSYKFTATATTNNLQLTTNEVLAQTMDTTSHNFTWQTFTFGERTSTLYDVAIINQNNIWAVGEIYMNDSLGNPDPHAYNAVHWDGQSWKLKRIYTYSSCNAVDYAPLRAIWAFSDTDIVVTSGGSIGWFNGKTNKPDCSIRPLLTGSINKLWGSSSNDLYAVGNGGNIAHFQNGVWKKMESGTTTDLADIYGDGENVFISGYKDFMPTVLLRYKYGVLTKIIEDDLFGYKRDTITGWIKSIWLKGSKLFSLTFYDLYRSSVDTKGEGTAMWKGDINTWGSNAVRGNDVNDIFITGYNGILWHYNGVSWKRYDELLNPNNHYIRLCVTEKLIVIVGFKYLNGIENYGLITIGKR
ncbi:MAG: glucosyl transferase [Ignavibacteriaceae bacterium]|nr:glucosyl transferase [Ignavibacteriaceae bacterium]